MNERFQLFVEGKDDEAVSCQLALKCDDLCEPNRKETRGPKFFVRKSGADDRAIYGIDDLIEEMTIVLTTRSFDRLGIVIDADEDAARRWQSMERVLKTTGYDSPNDPDVNGTVIAETATRARVGVWIWPDNQNPGMLEHFIESLIHPADKLLPQAKQCVEKAISIEQRFPDPHRQKAIIHTWLAWQEKAGRPQGVAIRAGFLDTTGELAQRYIAWLVRLFA